jgi:hypothetical protein
MTPLSVARDRPSAYRPVEVEQALRAEPGLVLGDVLQRTGGVYETTTRLTPKSRGDIREIAELTSDDELLAVASRTASHDHHESHFTHGYLILGAARFFREMS